MSLHSRCWRTKTRLKQFSLLPQKCVLHKLTEWIEVLSKKGLSPWAKATLVYTNLGPFKDAVETEVVLTILWCCNRLAAE